MTLAGLLQESLALVIVAFLAGGFVKGVAGIGLPLVAVPLIAMVVDAPTAVALMVVPVLASNGWQAARGGALLATARKYWVVALPLLVFTVGSAQFITRVDPAIGAAALGVIVVAVTLVQALAAPPMPLSPQWRGRLAPLVGAASGLLGGVSNLFGPPLILYLTSLRLPKDEFVSTIGALFLIGSLPLYGTLMVSGVLDDRVLLLSLAASLPVLAGYGLGVRLRGRLAQRTFQRVLYAVVVLIGLNLIRRALV